MHAAALEVLPTRLLSEIRRLAETGNLRVLSCRAAQPGLPALPEVHGRAFSSARSLASMSLFVFHFLFFAFLFSLFVFLFSLFSFLFSLFSFLFSFFSFLLCLFAFRFLFFAFRFSLFAFRFSLFAFRF